MQKSILELRNIGREYGYTNTRSYGKHNKRSFAERILKERGDSSGCVVNAPKEGSLTGILAEMDILRQEVKALKTTMDGIPLVRKEMEALGKSFGGLQKDVETQEGNIRTLRETNRLQTDSIRKLREELKAHQKQSLKERLKLENGIVDNLDTLETNRDRKNKKKEKSSGWWW